MNENEWNSAVNTFEKSMAGLTQTIDNLNRADANKWAATEQMKWTEEMMNKENAWSLNMWNKTNEYNDPSAQLERLKRAGLNPLYYGLDGSSASAFQSAQAQSYERANIENRPNPIEVASRTGLASAQARSLEKDLELKNAQIDKLREEETGLKLDNEFKDRTLSARAEGVELANNLTKEQISQVKQEIEESKKRVGKLIEETKSEVERQGLIVAQKTLAQAQEKEIVELLPLKKNLIEAQTQAQKAAASASYAHALYEKGLIDSGSFLCVMVVLLIWILLIICLCIWLLVHLILCSRLSRLLLKLLEVVFLDSLGRFSVRVVKGKVFKVFPFSLCL